MSSRPYMRLHNVPPVRFRDLQRDFVRFLGELEARAGGYDSPDSAEVSEDRAIKRACARFFGALDAVRYAAEKVADEPDAHPDAVYGAYTARIADIIESLHRERRRPEYAGKDPRADLGKAVADLRRIPGRASRRYGAIVADVYKEIARQVEGVATGDPFMPLPAAGSDPVPMQQDAGPPAAPSEIPEPPCEAGASVPGPGRGHKAIRRNAPGDGPDFLLRLRLTGRASGMPHDYRAGAPVLVVYGSGDGSPEDQAVYEGLLQESYRRGGVYPCAEACGARHPAMTVARLDLPSRQETLLYVAPSEHRTWMLPDTKLIGVTRDMSPESAGLVFGEQHAAFRLDEQPDG